MGDRQLREYFLHVNRHIANEDGPSLASCLALDLTSHAAGAQLLRFLPQIDIAGACDNSISLDLWGPAVAAHLRALLAASRGEDAEACKQQEECHRRFLDAFSMPGNWALPVFFQVSVDLRAAAVKADITEASPDSDFLRGAQNQLMEGWKRINGERVSIRDPSAKKIAIFKVTNLLFKVYFQLKKWELCKNIVNVIERPDAESYINNLDLFPVPDVVTYRFYVGRLRMFEDKYEEARECFTFALRNCPATEKRNRQRILAHLVPVNLCFGIVPTEQLLQRYNLDEFRELAHAMRIGDIRGFNDAMQEHERKFIRFGLYLVLEKAKGITYRNFFKRMYLIQGTHQLPIAKMESVLKNMGEDVDLDEIECILANLIFQGRIKGYLSHEKRVLVVSKKDPFPTSAAIVRS